MSGCMASANDRLRSTGQRYRAKTMPQAMKLNTMLIPNKARVGIINIFLALGLELINTAGGTSEACRPAPPKKYITRVSPPKSPQWRLGGDATPARNGIEPGAHR